MGTHAHIHSATTERGAIARERLVVGRAAPVVLFVDGSGSLRASSAEGETLWVRFERELRTLVALHRAALDRNDSVATLLPDGSHLLHIVGLGGEGHALLLEPCVEPPSAFRYDRFALTPREREVARLLIDGANTAEIALALSIAPSTVAIHVKGILAKTGSKTRAAAVGRMVQHDGGRSKSEEKLQ